MLLSSRVPNSDPKPHRCILCSDRFARPKDQSFSSHVTKPVPRDKFANPGLHPVNQVLRNFRATAGPEQEALGFLVAAELHAIARGDRDHHGDDATGHATKVLARFQRVLLTDGISR